MTQSQRVDQRPPCGRQVTSVSAGDNIVLVLFDPLPTSPQLPEAFRGNVRVVPLQATGDSSSQTGTLIEHRAEEVEGQGLDIVQW